MNFNIHIKDRIRGTIASNLCVSSWVGATEKLLTCERENDLQGAGASACPSLKETFTLELMVI